jgi:hypothetical protein
MQICIVDNSTAKIDWESFLTPEETQRIEVFRQPEHVGLGENWNTCIRQARGHLVHILHDDDWILTGFYDEITQLNKKHPEAALLATRSFTTDSDGVLIGISQRLRCHESFSSDFNIFVEMNPLLCPSIVFRRDFSELNGGFISDFRHCIDWEMWLRGTVKNGLIVSKHPLCCYRVSKDSDSGESIKKATNLTDYLKIYLFSKKSIFEFPINRSIKFLIAWALSQEAEMKSRGETEAAARARKVLDTILPLAPSPKNPKLKWLLHGVGNKLKTLAEKIP